MHSTIFYKILFFLTQFTETIESIHEGACHLIASIGAKTTLVLPKTHHFHVYFQLFLWIVLKRRGFYRILLNASLGEYNRSVMIELCSISWFGRIMNATRWHAPSYYTSSQTPFWTMYIYFLFSHPKSALPLGLTVSSLSLFHINLHLNITAGWCWGLACRMFYHIW